MRWPAAALLCMESPCEAATLCWCAVLAPAEDDKAAQQAAEEARKKSGKQQEQPSRPDWGSVPGNLQQAIDEKKAKRSSKKAMFADDGGDAAVQVSVKVRWAGLVRWCDGCSAVLFWLPSTVLLLACMS
jgi:hypothetical protein